MSLPPLRYLSAADVTACLPAAGDRVDLASTALRALARDDAEMPSKIGVHPRPGALLHAMPAWLRGADLVGMKWVSAFPGNKDRGLPAIAGLIVLNDPDSGLPTWILDASVITAHRTAAVSGVAIRMFAPGARAVTVIGAGAQARSHVELIAELRPSSRVTIHDIHPDRAEALAGDLREQLGMAVEADGDPRRAVGSAELVITAATLKKDSAFIDPDWLAPGALVVAVDFASCVRAEVAAAARLFATDERGQYMDYRERGYFPGYPPEVATLGELLDGPVPTAGDGDPRPVLVSHLGVGLADVVFADAITRRAEAAGAGVELAR